MARRWQVLAAGAAVTLLGCVQPGTAPPADQGSVRAADRSVQQHMPPSEPSTAPWRPSDGDVSPWARMSDSQRICQTRRLRCIARLRASGAWFVSWRCNNVYTECIESYGSAVGAGTAF